MDKVYIINIISGVLQPNTPETDQLEQVPHYAEVNFSNGTKERFEMDAKCPVDAVSKARDLIARNI
jgi:hypothetical protein